MKKGLINFAVSFAISALIFGIAAPIIVQFVLGVTGGSFGGGRHTEEPEKSTSVSRNESSSTGNILSEIDGSSFSLLLVMTDYRPDVYDDYVPDTTHIDPSKVDL